MSNRSNIPSDFLREIPHNLPIPVDDNACFHLIGLLLPNINLTSTSGNAVNLSKINGLVVIYCYPMTGKPNQTLPQGWILIPGAAGCTPQSCSFRDHYQELIDLNVKIFGISTQSRDDQLEAVNRLHLPFELLSDVSLNFANALKLPTFEVEGRQLLKRVTIIAKNGQILKYFYPVFPPDKNIDDVLLWLREEKF
ncbi:peroxiredoxin [Geminocystis sp. NIES-3709]|uniref:peroxiredoxin n=1 Tax=Geminocystis sp. NIES-3709 TaxID=1617448 RepID=UPI0005FC4A4D|nr:peroxiredoxin [Geminocystis sp. NIES-3709]BAQ66498.1 alkyl hydroperoxide reductase subunit C-like protein [Geminocystis sp. NIES-3709]